MSSTADSARLFRRAGAMRFPQGFVFGAATSAYQIEGGFAADGKGESIWDRFCRQPGAIVDGQTGNVACDHYNRLTEDLALMRSMGLRAYRFSVSWPRIQPSGSGVANVSGLDFYDRLVDGLLAAGIAPFVTLYHWDLPQALQEAGGWFNRDTAQRFADYAGIVSARLGDRVERWATLNEPWTFAWSGHAIGEDAPGLALGVRGGLLASHTALLAHGLAVPVIRAAAPKASVGIVLDVNVTEPASPSPEDAEAARAFDGVQNRWYLQSIFKGSYPADILDLCRDHLPEIRSGDMAIIAAPIDWLGVNIYRRSVIGAGADLPPLDFARAQPPGSYSAIGWEIRPSAIRDVLVKVAADYGPPEIFITENGMATEPESPGPEGRIVDADRAAYILDHLAEAARAIDDGVPLKGYFAWTLLDNFEWAYGYTMPFGIVHVDRTTQERRVKLSGEVYARLIAQNAIADRAAAQDAGAAAPAPATTP